MLGVGRNQGTLLNSNGEQSSAIHRRYFRSSITKSATIAATVLALFVFSTACETADDNSVQKARSCVDSAMKLTLSNPSLAATNAATCEAYVASVNTAEAGRVAFMTTLIEQQKISQLASAAGALNSSGSSSAVGTSMLYLAYSTPTASSTMWVYALRSNSSGILKMGALIQMATLANSVGGGISQGMTNAQIATAVSNIAATGSATDAANAVLGLQSSVCSGSGATSTNCSKITTAIGGATTPSTILNNIATAISSGAI